MKNEKSILFVDDEEEILDILVDLFSSDGYKLHTATNVQDALDIASTHDLDFVLSDLKLPDSSGKELLQRIQSNSPETVRVLASGYFDVDFGKFLLDEKDGTYYLSKPWDLWKLKELVTERLA